MSYTLDRLIETGDMQAVEARTREALQKHGFGVLTEIDVSGTLKKKLDVDMPGYRILGACNPAMAHRALQMEPRLGVMLPCNVILRRVEGGIEVSAVDPVASMAAIDNDELKKLAETVRQMLADAIADI
jgi:uncharacterized protein (DUF302 family)